MITDLNTSPSRFCDIGSEATWNDLYVSLRPYAGFLVYSFHLPSWYGQEEETVDDIVQETMRRIVEHVRKAERGEAAPIHSLKGLMTVIARNYCKDLWRSEYKYSPMRPQEYTPELSSAESVHPGSLDVAIEQAYLESLFELIAREIANFPDKQRKALLIDLANRMDFDAQPTPLQKAFLKVGIQLQQYQLPLPHSARERSRHTSILYIAYQRVALLPCVQRYIHAA